MNRYQKLKNEYAVDSKLCNYSTSPHFLEPEGSLLCSQEPSIGPYCEPDQSSSYHPMLFLQDLS
jgi:hypothetical protein